MTSAAHRLVRSIAVGGLVSTLVTALPARANCAAANQYSLLFSGQTAATLNYATTYTYPATSTALGTSNVTIAWANNGMNAATSIGTLPKIGADVNGNTGGNALIAGGTLPARTVDIKGALNTLLTTIGFARPVRDVAFTIDDIDFAANQFRDWIYIVGIGPAGNYVPALTTPFGQANGGGPYTAAGSSVQLGPQATAPATLVDTAIGVSTANNNTNVGDINVSFAQPVTSVQLRYGNYPLQAGETATGQQFFAITVIRFCPMPALTVTKTSAPFKDPVNGTANPKLIPGGDLLYSVTVSNANTSPVDLSTLTLTDVLPAGLTFYNGDIDDAGPLTGNYQLVDAGSGVAMPASAISYSNNGGASYGYTPASGYDPNVTGVRIAPTGSLAAGGSFTVRFRTRLK